MLLVKRIGISGVAVLKGGRLKEADRRQVASRECSEEVIDVVLVVRRIRRAGVRDVGKADRRYRAWACVGRITRRGIVLEPCMVRNVVDRREGRCAWSGRIGLAGASGRAVGIGDRQ